MLVFSILPDALRVPLDKVESEGVLICTYPGVTAVIKPMDLLEISRWYDGSSEGKGRIEAATKLMLERLIAIEGFGVRDEQGNVSAFDAKNPLHHRAIPFDMRTGIFQALRSRGIVSEAQEKNSDSPSVSGGTSGSASLSAEAVVSAPATT